MWRTMDSGHHSAPQLVHDSDSSCALRVVHYAGCAYGIGTPAVLSRNICERLAQSRAAFVVVNAQELII